MIEADVVAIEIRLLIEAIRLRYDYDLGNYSSSFLSRRLGVVLARSGVAHLGELQHRVLSDPSAFFALLEDLSVRVSDMFRDPEVFAAFRSDVVPMLRTYPMLKVWHAGCASGEEVYTTAIILQEADLYERCQIYATDLSATALEHAREGVYPAERLEEFVANYAGSGGTASFDRYFTIGYGNLAMRESLRRNVLFFQHNLIADYVFGEMHAIFCRNVLIYYDRPTKQRMLETFTKSLRPGGVLCLGASERLLPDELVLGFRELVPGTRIYRYDPPNRDVPSSETRLRRDGSVM